MFNVSDILIFVKYFISALIVVGIVFAPAYLARVTGKGKYDMLLVRIFSWLFGWTGIGWLWALFISSKK
ncbi:MAG: hypothetical protein JW985_03770 [Alphaproteobacteria bacterium]|jgi:hypothetical protein|nr:hypothetical protein [Alphaproteobacteria bacterium]